MPVGDRQGEQGVSAMFVYLQRAWTVLSRGMHAYANASSGTKAVAEAGLGGFGVTTGQPGSMRTLASHIAASMDDFESRIQEPLRSAGTELLVNGSVGGALRELGLNYSSYAGNSEARGPSFVPPLPNPSGTSSLFQAQQGTPRQAAAANKTIAPS